MNRNAAKTALSILRKYFHNICGLTFNDIATHEFAATHTHPHPHPGRHLHLLLTPVTNAHRWEGDMEGMPFDKVKDLLIAAKDVIRNDKTVVDLKPPVYVIGDLHGNYFVCTSLHLSG